MAFANHVIPATKSHMAHHFHHRTTLPHSFDSLYIILLIVPMTEHTSSDPLIGSESPPHSAKHEIQVFSIIFSLSYFNSCLTSFLRAST